MILIAYASKYGATAEAAKKLAAYLKDAELEIKDLTKDKVDLSRYDRVIIGGPIYAGSLHSAVKKFVSANQMVLLDKKLALYISGVADAKFDHEQLVRVYGETLVQHAVSAIRAGYIVDPKKLKFLERFILEKITGKKEYQSVFEEEAIKDLAESILK
ncbi:MAG: flavodoxin domain-containing protein [Erysipelotrichaceae bacterium]|nr:flavodoxin domain-containing protein [Erysipelotrichaceae bacterium]